MAEGSRYKACTTCSHKVTEAIPIDASNHAPASTWEKDATGHWHKCTRCNCALEKVPHTYNAQNICTVCAHVYVNIGLKFSLSEGTYTVTDYTGTATEVGIPATYKGVAVTSIGDDAFYDCDSLTSVTISDSVTSIGGGAFAACSNLYAVYITDLVAWCNITFGNSSANPLCYAKRLYLNGNKVTALEIPSGITAIKDYAFYDCDSLTSVTIPASVTSIGRYAFEGCTGLAAVYISDLAAWCNITFGNYYANPLKYASNLYLNGQRITALEIPSGITAIKDYAFYNYANLNSVTIPASVTSIGNRAFYECYLLTSITIPASVTSIGEYAFAWCSRLITVEFGANSRLTSIGEYAFAWCSRLITVEFGANSRLTSIGDEAFSHCSNLTSVTIPAGVTSIGGGAFYQCTNLTSVTISQGVTSIGNSAFYGCSKLTTVYYGGTASDWNKITIGDYNTNLTNATRYYYSATEPTTAGKWWYYGNDGKPAVWPQ